MIILKKTKKSLELYPIGSPKGALNTKRNPEYMGIIKFKESSKGIAINKFIIRFEAEDKLTPPSEAIKLLKSQAVFLTFKSKKIEEFLKSNDIKVRFTNICQHCVLDGNITILKPEFSYSYHNQDICKRCAEDTIKRELKLNGYDKKVYKIFKKALEKTGNLNEVLDMMSSKFDPIKNQNLTLFDKVKVAKSKLPQIPISRLKIDKNFKEILDKDNNTFLLPVQYLAIKEGLLKGKNLLVVSATGSGKTLVGELAGIPKAMEGEKFIFLTPLVALANQKYRDFKKKYEKLGLKVALKVGTNRINAKEELKLPESNVKDSDIIVGTYEGMDFLLRSGKSNDLRNLGTVLIDEIHTLDDEVRGTRLNGLINRLEYIYPQAQIIGLSATIKNPQAIGENFKMNLVQYNQRPVPLERYLVFVKGEMQKRNLIKKLILKEHHIKSSKGILGQTIVFTNSRRKTHQIADYLNRKGISVAAYHAGLSYFKKEKIEKDFEKGKITTVVTTAALAAGVDFPASQVIFETLLMGNKWISPNEFSQMLGRAGRPSYHDRGIVYLIPEIGSKFDDESEESVAISLLESDVERVHVNYNQERFLEQLLADISSETIKNTEELDSFYKSIQVPMDIDMAIDELYERKLINVLKDDNEEMIFPTKYGIAVSMSFLSVDEGEYIKNSLKSIERNEKESKKLKNNQKKSKKLENNQKKNNELKNNQEKNKKLENNQEKKDIKESLDSQIINMAIELEYLENAYLSPVLHKQIVDILKRSFSTKLFSESTLDIISSGELIEKLDKKFQDVLLKIQIDFLRCECKDKPFCNCLQKGISYFIVKERLNKKDPIDISRKLFKNYQIQTYPGDVFSWLDTMVRNLEAIERIAIAQEYKKYSDIAKKLIKSIEKG